MRLALVGYQAIAVKAVQDHFPAGTRMAIPLGGYFLWLELPPAVDTLELHVQARKQRISLAPGPLFSADRRFTHCLRLNYGHGSDVRFLPALRTIGELATQQCAAAAACGISGPLAPNALNDLLHGFSQGQCRGLIAP
jgi:DNA-binding transcriptional MocR family regulator